ncbi:conserved hypothetical protein [Verticillium alfalfae VaMs.102]|uniref:Uncharacterized protein n=1 Tax=Verticillium alfalfae (strain VaMs.102 / ATCC MYA-4576 / FGSC 10136) TaxID=526221 RepID=C9SV30_VERA1|nr:conserved hypothetical protein [Verticillium alfalfae VaMs.102]EEY22645.1 conserved hypothetical protein [Verticillium alfalfae VaMs.102]
MAACSRGLALGVALRGPLSSARQPFSTSRTFTTLSCFQAAARKSAPARLAVNKPTRILPSKATSTPKPTAAPRAAAATPLPSAATTTNPLLLQLARSPSPTILYESASHFWMKATAWTTTSACYAAAVANWYLTAPADAAWFVPNVYTMTCVALAGMGSFFVFGAANIVRAVRAVPTATLVGRALPPGVNPRLTPVMLEVAVKPSTLRRRLFEPRVTRGKLRSIGTGKRPPQGKVGADKQRLLTMPFRDAWRGAKMAWEGVRRALTGGGFVKMTVGDRKCKLDVATGWALDDGLALQKLVRIEKQGQ